MAQHARLSIRPFRDADAPGLAEWIDALAPAEDVYTPAALVHQRHRLPVRGHPVWLVARQAGELVGLARDEPQIFRSRPGLRRVWVGVRPDRRRHGIGGQLWDRIIDHARARGAQVLRSWALGAGSDGERFLLGRGFANTMRELQSWLDPCAIDFDDLDRRTAHAQQRGFQVKTLREVLPGLEDDLRRLYLDADQDVPGPHGPAARVAASTFRKVILRNPILDPDCSTVVLHQGRPVALSWLKGDRARGRYGVEFTGTASDWRGHGLARLAKMSALRLAAAAGLRWVGTANDHTNAPMLAINRQLGSHPLDDMLFYERSL